MMMIRKPFRCLDLKNERFIYVIIISLLITPQEQSLINPVDLWK